MLPSSSFPSPTYSNKITLVIDNKFNTNTSEKDNSNVVKKVIIAFSRKHKCTLTDQL